MGVFYLSGIVHPVYCCTVFRYQLTYANVSLRHRVKPNGLPVPYRSGVPRAMSAAAASAAGVFRWLPFLAIAITAVWSAELQGQPTRPGSPSIDVKRIKFGVVEYTLTLVKEGEDDEYVGIVRDEILPFFEADPVLRRVQVLIRSGAMTIDSTWSDGENLAPRWHKSVQPKRTIEFEMSGLELRGVIAPNDTTAITLDTTFKEQVFDASNWDLVVRALPLNIGDASTIATWDAEKKGQQYSVRVIDRQSWKNTDVIHVTVELGGGRMAHAWFDENTRVLLRVETQLSPDTVLRQILKGR